MDKIYQFLEPYLYYYGNTLLDYYAQMRIYYNDNVKPYLTFDDEEKDAIVLNAMIANDSISKDITGDLLKILNKKSAMPIQWSDLDHILKEIEEETGVGENFHLDIKYSLEDNHYRVIYNFQHGKEIQFPPYTREELEKQKRDNQRSYKKKVLYAELVKNGEGEDITHLVQQYAGPMGNFYVDKHHNIHASLIKDENGRRVLVENEEIQITDTLADDRVFKNTDIIQL